VDSALKKNGLGSESFEFVAFPKKDSAIEKIICPLAKKNSATIVLVDDALQNIKNAMIVVQGNGIEMETFMIQRERQSASLRDIDVAMQGVQSPRIFVFDMDDTLLHEKFRKEHQPVNIYLEMRKLGLV